MTYYPWNRPKLFPLRYRLNRVQLAIVLSMILVLGVTLIAATPSINALADRIARFFTSDFDDTIEIDLPPFYFTETEEGVSTSFSEAVQQAGFEVKKPTKLPNGYMPAGVSYNPTRRSITLSYKSSDGSILRITQRPAGIEYQSISIHANVEKVRINNLTGEYVSGGWRVPPPEGHQKNLSITVEALWDPDANIHFLRWQEEDILCEILFSSADIDSTTTLDKNDLIDIAENLK